VQPIGRYAYVHGFGWGDAVVEIEAGRVARLLRRPRILPDVLDPSENIFSADRSLVMSRMIDGFDRWWGPCIGMAQVLSRQ
jgi:hypothetical protein